MPQTWTEQNRDKLANILHRIAVLKNNPKDCLTSAKKAFEEYYSMMKSFDSDDFAQMIIRIDEYRKSKGWTTIRTEFKNANMIMGVMESPVLPGEYESSSPVDWELPPPPPMDEEEDILPPPDDDIPPPPEED